MLIVDLILSAKFSQFPLFESSTVPVCRKNTVLLCDSAFGAY